MSNEINVASLTGKTIYVLAFNQSGEVWDAANENFETYLTAQRDNYDIVLTEQGTASGIYLADFPTAITSSGSYTYYAYFQGGASPAEGDTLVASGVVDWTGSASVGASTGSMAGSDFRDYVLRGGFKRTDKDTELYEAVTDTIQDLRVRFGFSEAQAETTTTDTITSLGDFNIDLESDFGLLVGIAIEDGTDANKLTQLPKWKFDQLYPDINVTSEKGYPKNFTIYGDKIIIGPIPDSVAYSYRISYSKRAGTISSATTAVPFTNVYRELLRDGTLARLWEGVEQYQTAGYFYNKFESRLIATERREELNASEHTFAVQSQGDYD